MTEAARGYAADAPEPAAPAAPAAPGAASPATPRSGPLDLPDRRLFWRWVWDAVRPVVGWVLAGVGALALLLGWWGVSGQALTAKQLPYLVSGGLTGIALIILAAVFLATDDIRRQLAKAAELERKIDDLYALFVADLAAPPATAGAGWTPSGASAAAGTAPTPVGGVVALPSGSSYHRPDCALVAGKAEAAAVDAATIAARGLRPCRVCDPVSPAGG